MTTGSYVPISQLGPGRTYRSHSWGRVVHTDLTVGAGSYIPISQLGPGLTYRSHSWGRVLRTDLTVGAGVAGRTLTGVGPGVVDAHAAVQTRAALTVVNIWGIHPRGSDYTRYTYFNISNI